MARLVVFEPGRVGFSVPLKGELRVGRAPDNDLVLIDPEVSRQHLRLVAAGTSFRVEDLASTHGTKVNGRKIDRAVLADRDRIQLGNVILEYALAEDLAPVDLDQKTAPLGWSVPGSAAPSSEAERRHRLFYDIGAAVGALDDSEQLLGRMLDTMLELLEAEHGVVGLAQSQRSGARQIARKRGGRRVEPEIVVGREHLDAMVQRGERLLLERGDRSAMGVPLLRGSRALGFVYLDDHGRARRFSREDLELLSALGHLTAAALESAEAYQSAARAAEAMLESSTKPELVGDSEPMQRLRREIAECARASDAHVLIHGESGTGKELVARSLHSSSERAPGPFVALNCAAIPESMVESELFGYERGAFTGAARDKRGKFQLAHHGTLFLDEIGDLSLSAQAKLLRAIEAGEVQPLGSERTLLIDIRIVSATHRDLSEEVAAGRFREDLFYRLNVFELTVPPLRDRGGDLILLADTFRERASRRLNKRLAGFTPRAIQALEQHPWPGNVRELENVIERAVIVSPGPAIDAVDLGQRLTGSVPPAGPSTSGVHGRARTLSGLAAAKDRPLAERFAELEPAERALVQEALAQAGGNVSEAARLLGITRIMMKRRLERFGLP